LVIENKLTDHIIPICIDDKTVFDQIKEIVRSVVLRNLSNFDPNPIITGESKLFYKINNMPTLALVELKPTLYSFTHNRYGNVDGTDNLRNDFWNLFSSKLNNSMINFQLENINFVSRNLNCLAQKWVDMSDYTLISDHLGFIAHKSKIYNLVIFDKAIPNIEVVWKKYLYGTMKHTLDTVDKYPVRNRPETKIQYEGILPKSITRFDWRNPLPGKDECIPEDFADFYIDVKNAKLTSEVTSLLLSSILIESGFYLIDLCYFMNESGTQIKSEITPDGMRIKNFKNESFDKDLWRHGSANETIVDTWIKLLAELEKNKDTVISGLVHQFEK
jgi:phosphoribosylaminoimidazole-succinocarboxamide synthase